MKHKQAKETTQALLVLLHNFLLFLVE